MGGKAGQFQQQKPSPTAQSWAGSPQWNFQPPAEPMSWAGSTQAETSAANKQSYLANQQLQGLLQGLGKK